MHMQTCIHVYRYHTHKHMRRRKGGEETKTGEAIQWDNRGDDAIIGPSEKTVQALK